MSGRGFAKFVEEETRRNIKKNRRKPDQDTIENASSARDPFQRESSQPDPSHGIFKFNCEMSDDQRKACMRSYAKKMRDQPGFQEVVSKLNFEDLSDSEDDYPVLSLEQTLADIDSKREPASE